MKKRPRKLKLASSRIAAFLSTPVMRPAEVWAMRILLGYMTIHFGLKV